MILWLGMYVIFGKSSFNSSLEVSIFIGAPYAFPNGRREAGQAYVVFGRPSFTSPLALSSLDVVIMDSFMVLQMIAQESQYLQLEI
ncbi:MAG: hypothetical protein MRQ09_04555 [Candidatus Midichloria sp.]|nr:hypothetical protein [Candidatus Midichloria sp.]